MGLLDTILYGQTGRDKIEQSHIATAQDRLALQQQLAQSATPVADSVIGPAFKQTAQIAPDLPTQVSSALSAPTTDTLPNPDVFRAPSNAPDFVHGGAFQRPASPDVQMPTAAAGGNAATLPGTAATTTADAPADTVHPSRLFTYGGQQYVLHTPEEMHAIANAVKANQILSEMRAKNDAEHENRVRNGVWVSPENTPGYTGPGYYATEQELSNRVLPSETHLAGIGTQQAGATQRQGMKDETQVTVGAGHDKARVDAVNAAGAYRKDIAQILAKSRLDAASITHSAARSGGLLTSTGLAQVAATRAQLQKIVDDLSTAVQTRKISDGNSGMTMDVLPGEIPFYQSKLAAAQQRLSEFNNILARHDAAAAARAPQDRNSGAYQAGRVYGGLKFLGGDPNNQASWQKVR